MSALFIKHHTLRRISLTYVYKEVLCTPIAASGCHSAVALHVLERHAGLFVLVHITCCVHYATYIVCCLFSTSVALHTLETHARSYTSIYTMCTYDLYDVTNTCVCCFFSTLVALHTLEMHAELYILTYIKCTYYVYYVTYLWLL